ncbi:TPA: type II toxin-antitoxin system RelE/ParE family toxin [Vibrio cholerae]|nr:type II toxin-antitoxin system RelE/ParE family toxin [Vibrio cholerae]
MTLCNLIGMSIYTLHAFVKKSQKTPKNELNLARDRQKEVQKS